MGRFMTPPPAPSVFHTLRATLAPFVPAKLKARWTVLTLQQRRTLSIVSAGLMLFLLIWLVFSSGETPPTQIVSAHQLQMPSDERGTQTAISKSVKNFPQDNHIAAVVNPVKTAPIATVNLTPLQQNQLLELRQNVDNIYKSVLSFSLDEAKMIVFAQAATKIDMVNAKWDTLIAGAADDNLAVEYLTSATLESKAVLAQTVGITAGEYNEIYTLSTRDANFNKIANAYKKLVAEGIWGPVTPILSDDKAKPANPDLRFPVAKTTGATAAPQIMPQPAIVAQPPVSEPVVPQSAINPAPNSAIPVVAGTVPATPDSPAPPYSPPAAH